MGSLAADGAGDLALGYSVAGTSVYPSVRYVGRLASDPPGTLPHAEGSFVEGAGSQTGASRWGDYSGMSVDPADDCTFWYTQEYYAATSPWGWRTRIGGFRFDGCGTCPLVDVPVLSASRGAGVTTLSWSAAANASDYGLVEGDLDALRSIGSFATAVVRCLAASSSTTSLSLSDPDPLPGQGRWYLARGQRGVCKGTWGEVAGGGGTPRDAAIATSPAACP